MRDRSIEDLERRCPRLGSVISFRYCLISGEDDLPCWKIFDCWWESFDVDGYLKQNLPEALYHQLKAAAERPKNKLGSIIEMIHQAKNQSRE
jgi:hypothetical protein